MRTQLRHPFRFWLEEQEIAEPALGLFDEGMVCYAAGAYRAAVVFSYLGLLRAVAHRLMLAAKPPKFPDNHWDELQSKVRDDGAWEGAIFVAMVMEKPASIFLIDDDLREQLRYWRSRRNDAAHARTNEIGAPHVEALWLFAKSNLPRLIVAGSRAGLYERFRRHFDPSYTAPGRDFSPLVGEIPNAVRADEFKDFVRDVLRLTHDISDEHDAYDEDDPYLSEAGGKLVDSILKIDNEQLTASLTELLRSPQSLLVGAIMRAPRLATLYANRGPFGSFIRKLWHDLLPFRKQHGRGDPINASLGVVAYLLRNGLIPDSERDEAMRHIIGKIHEGYPHSDYTAEVMDALTEVGFWKAVEQYGIGAGWHAPWVAVNLALVVEYLERHKVTVELARAFAYLAPPEMDWEDDYLRGNRFCEFEDILDVRMGYFDDHQDKLAEIVRVARENDVDISRFEMLMRPELQRPFDAAKAPS